MVEYGWACRRSRENKGTRFWYWLSDQSFGLQKDLAVFVTLLLAAIQLIGNTPSIKAIARDRAVNRCSCGMLQ
jgi:hypothetical protein